MYKALTNSRIKKKTWGMIYPEATCLKQLVCSVQTLKGEHLGKIIAALLGKKSNKKNASKLLWPF